MRASQVLTCIIVIGLISCDTKPITQGKEPHDTKPTTKETNSGDNNLPTPKKDSRDIKSIRADDSESTPEKIESICDTNNRFALDLFKRLDKENLFFSPYSIRTALAMVLEGARGGTAAEMAKKLYLPANLNEQRPNLAAVFNMLHSQPDIELFSANALWVQKSFPMVPEYLSIIERYYVGKAQPIDFVGSPEESSKIINSWVENQTNQKITNLITPDSIEKLTRLVLTNAIYFNAAWVHKFKKESTCDSLFWVNSKKSVATKMMLQMNEFNYMEDDTVQVLEMPYQGDRLSMLVVLPKDKEGLAKVEKFLTVEKISGWRSQFKRQYVLTYIPKVTFTNRFQLTGLLSSMGINKMFTPKADFSGISKERGLFISEIIHQAFVRIHEEGTEAVAVTMMGVGVAGIAKKEKGPTIFRADHTFLFFILDKKTDLFIFMGKISNPSQLQETGIDNASADSGGANQPGSKDTGNWCREYKNDVPNVGVIPKRNETLGGDFVCNPIITGSLEKELICQVIRSHRDQMHYCYLQELTRNPKLAGKVSVKFVVGAKGFITQAAVSKSTLNDAVVEQCIIQKIKTWRFLEPKDGGSATVTYPFIFKGM